MKVKLNKGFTLIEIIIVIVIIGVLATLALPRITGQIEAARGAEAMNMFGAIRRAAINCIDMGNLTGTVAGAQAAAASCLTFAQLGMTAPTGAQFTYSATQAAGVMQFRALKAPNAICLNLDAGTAQGQYSIFPVGATNPYSGAVQRTTTVGGAVCAAANLATLM
jgi:prepilin-type N-terminal cleavage/methylation domain-containing protein